MQESVMTLRRRNVTIAALATCLIASTMVGALVAPAQADDADPVAPSDASVTFLAGLPYRDKALEQAAKDISTPGNPDFRRHLSVEQAAQRFGASDAAITKVRKAAKRLGLQVEIDPTRMVARLTGSVATWEKVMGSTIQYQPAQEGSPYNQYEFAPDESDVPAPVPGSPTLWQEYYLATGLELTPTPASLARVVTDLVPSYAEYVPSMDVPLTPTQDAEADLRNSLAGPIGDQVANALRTRSVSSVTLPENLSALSAGPTTRSLYYPGSKSQTPPDNPASALMANCINEPDAPLGTSLLGDPLTPSAFVGQDQLFRAYGLTALQKSAGARTSSRVTIISLGGGFSEDDLAAAADCNGYSKPEVQITTGTGVPSPFVNVDDETTLDVQTVAGTLRNAGVIQMVQASGANELSATLADAYSRALTTIPKPHSITLSYGFCEPLIAGRGLTATVDGLFQFAGVVGTTIAISAGDGGSTVCQAQFGEQLELLLAFYQLAKEAGSDPDSGVTPEELAADLAQLEEAIALLQPAAAYPRTTVSWPASSPYVMSVGGSQIVMNADGSRSGEVVWNDTPYMGGVIGNLVGTGGPSMAFDAPWYQQPLVPSNVRSVPDVSAQAGPFPSLPLVMDGAIGVTGGTSEASPMLAAAFALVSTRERQAGRPALGFPNPWLYDVARRHPATMYDVTIGDNQFAIPYSLNSTNVPSCCQAGPGFDAATGLGVPQFDVLIDHVQGR